LWPQLRSFFKKSLNLLPFSLFYLALYFSNGENVKFLFCSKTLKHKKQKTRYKINIKHYFLKPLPCCCLSPERPCIQIINPGLSKEPALSGSLSKEISAETGIDIECLGRSVLSVSVAVMFAGLAGRSGEDVLSVVVEVHECFAGYF
jgi:hypothetical protein